MLAQMMNVTLQRWMGLPHAHTLSLYQMEVGNTAALWHGRATRWKELRALNANVGGHLPNLTLNLQYMSQE